MYLVLDNQLNDYKTRFDQQISEAELFHTVGYFVIRNAVYLMEKQYLQQVINTLTKAMENLYKKEILEYMNEQLSDLYIHDAMSGLYNRLGGMKLSQELFEKSRRQEQTLFVMYVDLDRLKYINDNFGHEMGDLAIKAVSKSLRNHFEAKGIASRLGGDEFLIVGRAMPQEEIDALITETREELQTVQKNARLEFPLQISTGYVYTDINGSQKLDDYINLADGRMYEEKTAKKVNRTD